MVRESKLFSLAMFVAVLSEYAIHEKGEGWLNTEEILARLPNGFWRGLRNPHGASYPHVNGKKPTLARMLVNLVQYKALIREYRSNVAYWRPAQNVPLPEKLQEVT